MISKPNTTINNIFYRSISDSDIPVDEAQFNNIVRGFYELNREKDKYEIGSPFIDQWEWQKGSYICNINYPIYIIDEVYTIRFRYSVDKQDKRIKNLTLNHIIISD